MGIYSRVTGRSCVLCHCYVFARYVSLPLLYSRVMDISSALHFHTPVCESVEPSTHPSVGVIVTTLTCVCVVVGVLFCYWCLWVGALVGAAF